jgi:fido (protein-threonine AMPylation protein)
MSNAKLLCPIREKADREIANQAAVAEFLADFVRSGRTRITESVLLEIHRLTIEGIYPCAGTYRDALTKIEITDTDHKPAHASQVRTEVCDMLEWLYGEGAARSPIERAAYVLWRINYVHPFNGGNGRVARAMAYLVMAFEVAPIFSGEPLPAKLKARKQEYVEALKAADKGDLQPLQSLVLECFQAQIAEISRHPHA